MHQSSGVLTRASCQPPMPRCSARPLRKPPMASPLPPRPSSPASRTTFAPRKAARCRRAWALGRWLAGAVRNRALHSLPITPAAMRAAPEVAAAATALASRRWRRPCGAACWSRACNRRPPCLRPHALAAGHGHRLTRAARPHSDQAGPDLRSSAAITRRRPWCVRAGHGVCCGLHLTAVIVLRRVAAQGTSASSAIRTAQVCRISRTSLCPPTRLALAFTLSPLACCAWCCRLRSWYGRVPQCTAYARRPGASSASALQIWAFRLPPMCSRDLASCPAQKPRRCTTASRSRSSRKPRVGSSTVASCVQDMFLRSFLWDSSQPMERSQSSRPTCNAVLGLLRTTTTPLLSRTYLLPLRFAVDIA